MGDQGQADQASASWFFEERGQKDAPLVGPYRADEILKFVMDGVLKVEGRIYNAERDEWMVAADVIAHIPVEAMAEQKKPDAPAPQTRPVAPPPLQQAGVSAPPKSQPAPRVTPPAMEFSMPRDTRLERPEPEFRIPVAVAAAPPPPAGPAGWQPPPRPAELRNVHVVNSVTGDTGLIDYFALINRPAHRGPAGTAGAAKARAPMRAAERAVAAASQEALDEESAGTPKHAGKSDFGFDFSKSLSSASGYITRFGMILKRHQRPLYYAAAVAFVAAGAFGVVQYFGQKGREPATAANQPAATSSKASKTAAARTENLKLSSGSTIGTGSNKVARPSGGVAGGPAQNPNPGALNSAGGYSPQQDSRNASPQYYSSSEDSARAIAGNENALPQQQPYQQPVDPNRPVNPPGYFPPAGGEAGALGAGYAPPPNPEGPATY
ncbi:MAG: hypothetical protein HYW49_08945 [Deltaproteobacteria bacterium]|nr:hypothetical protein [Deltaproteobacteria bacterium]